ncbi:polar growth protein [Mortierella alpina]|nr:polar growth protein [Mortierella alpina]
MPETVWAIHNFEAEAEDEISFNIGEPIIVLQKDELYQDGWWEGTNVRGETGLFPQNYTVQNPPGQTQAEAPAPLRPNNGYGSVDGMANAGSGKPGGNANPNIANNPSVGNINHGGVDDQRTMSQPSHTSLDSNMSRLHIQHNSNMASPAMGSTRGGFGGTHSSTASNATPNSKVISQSVEESLNDPQLSGHPSTWSIDQVAYWLRLCGFGGVAPSFVENEISGAILLELNLNNLKELEINSFGKRFNIMNAITLLKQCTKGDMASKGLYGSMSNPSSMYGLGPNIPPRMTSAPIIVPSPRASYDLRGDFVRDPRQNVQDQRNQALTQPHSNTLQATNMRPQHHHQQHPDYELHSNQQQSRAAALARSDTIGSVLSAASKGDYAGPLPDVGAGRGAQRHSITSAYSSNSNPNRNQWDRNASRQPQVPTAVSPQHHGHVFNEYDETSFHGRASEQPPADQYPRAMEVSKPISPQMRQQDPYSSEIFQKPVPKQRKYHNPDSTNRPSNGKADPNDKVVPLELIGKPDYAGWLKKRGDTYRTWKSRWFMLKGVTLYYMNTPKDNASKDYINLVGYKIIQDENIYAGKYCFKAVHDQLRDFFFYTESESDMKGWLKALMKVTIGRDPTAPVISSSNIPTIPLHVARQMAPRPPSPTRRNRALGPNGQPMHPQQQQQQQQYDQRYQQQQQQQHQAQQPPFQQLLDYDDKESDSEEYLDNGFSSPRAIYNQGLAQGAGHSNPQNQTQPESPILQHITTPSQQQRHSFVHPDQQNGDDDPWRDEDGEGFSQANNAPTTASNSGTNGQQQWQQNLAVRPDSELDSFNQHAEETPAHSSTNARWTQEQYVEWLNRNLPSTVEPVSDMTQSLRSGVVLVRLIEQLSGEQVDKRIPNATYTLQMLENLLTAFKFMDRVGVSTDGYTVKDIFNGNEDKIVLMFESIRARFPDDAAPGQSERMPVLSTLSSPPSSGSLTIGNPSNGPLPPAPQSEPAKDSIRGNSPTLSHDGKLGQGALPSSNSPSPHQQQLQPQQQQQRIQPQHTGGSEFEALYDEAARSTIS